MPKNLRFSRVVSWPYSENCWAMYPRRDLALARELRRSCPATLIFPELAGSKAAEHAERGAFPGSIWPEYAKNLATVHCKGEFFHRFEIAKTFLQLLSLHNRLILTACTRGWLCCSFFSSEKNVLPAVQDNASWELSTLSITNRAVPPPPAMYIHRIQRYWGHLILLFPWNMLTGKFAFWRLFLAR